MESLIVPSSIQRIRSFLVEMCGMKVRPWAGTEETLGALHTTLCARHACDIFWTSLGGLLETLTRDLKTRLESRPGTLVDNEVLDSERYAALLEEIRATLARQAETPAPGSFRRLASALSAPALGLLLLLGGVASVACDSTPLHAPAKQQDAASPDRADARPPGPDTLHIIIPDTPPAKRAVASGSDGAMVTIQDIMDSCDIPRAQQDDLLACLAQLRESWATGLANRLAGMYCANVSDSLFCFTYSRDTVCKAGDSGEFDPRSILCQPVIIYAGVRFV